jgi:hypothetical protein
MSEVGEIHGALDEIYITQRHVEVDKEVSFVDQRHADARPACVKKAEIQEERGGEIALSIFQQKCFEGRFRADESQALTLTHLRTLRLTQLFIVMLRAMLHAVTQLLRKQTHFRFPTAVQTWAGVGLAPQFVLTAKTVSNAIAAKEDRETVTLRTDEVSGWTVAVIEHWAEGVSAGAHKVEDTALDVLGQPPVKVPHATLVRQVITVHNFVAVIVIGQTLSVATAIIVDWACLEVAEVFVRLVTAMFHVVTDHCVGDELARILAAKHGNLKAIGQAPTRLCRRTTVVLHVT